MKIHLLKSTEVDTTLFSKVVDFLQSIPGPIKFFYKENACTQMDEEDLFPFTIRDRDQFEKKIISFENGSSRMKFSFPLKRETISWSGLFKKVNQYRQQKNIPDGEFVLLLTDIPNKENWFAALDEKMPYNGFIHTADWEHYINCSAVFPIAYEVIALALQKHMFGGLYDLKIRIHEAPIGCVNDFCLNKREIILKLRTGDICEDCINRAIGKISMPEIHHALQLLGSLRENMLFSQNLKRFSPISRLVIDNRNKIFLADFNNIEIHLRPLEKALYFLFLQHPDGIYHSSLSDHKIELYEIYGHISTIGDLQEMHSRIDDMVNALSDSASQKISRIKRVFEEAIGPDLAAHYYIKGETGQKKKIELDRGLLVVNSK